MGYGKPASAAEAYWSSLERGPTGGGLARMDKDEAGPMPATGDFAQRHSIMIGAWFQTDEGRVWVKDRRAAESFVTQLVAHVGKKDPATAAALQKVRLDPQQLTAIFGPKPPLLERLFGPRTVPANPVA